ncbi:MAG: tetratricopeptide repeat protein [Thermodesulfobacteriota bacterium]
MKRWIVVVLVTMCLAAGAGPQGFAQTAVDKVKAANIRAAQDYLKSGFILAGEGRDEEAAKAFGNAVSIRPDWAEARSLYGSALARISKYAEAEAELRKAVALKPDYAEGWNFLGEFLKDRGKTAEAQEAFRKAKQYAR